jgi:RimJ/RimL family protein N-acetyltransferase
MHDKVIIRIGTDAEKQNLLMDYPNINNVIHYGGYFIVAKIEDTIVGYLWAFKREIPVPVEQNEIFINIIEVIYTNLRCQGIASAMLNEIIEIAKEEKAYQVRAYCDIGNISSHRLWLKNKFSINPVKMPDGSITGSFVSFVL